MSRISDVSFFVEHTAPILFFLSAIIFFLGYFWCKKTGKIRKPRTEGEGWVLKEENPEKFQLLLYIYLIIGFFSLICGFGSLFLFDFL